MSYAVKYYFVDKKIVGTTETTYTWELLEDGFVGSSTEWTGVSIQREYDQLDTRNIYKTLIQKSTCTGVIRVESSAQRAILEGIADATQNQYHVRLKRGAATLWTGKLIPDLLDIGEDNYGNQTASLTAKDLVFQGVYTLATGSVKAISIIADILDELGYGIQIQAYTNWQESNTASAGDDILNRVYHERERLRTYAQRDGESDLPLPLETALTYMLASYGLILRQAQGDWQLIQISALDNPASVPRYQYNSAGVQNIVVPSTVDLRASVDRDDLYLLGTSRNKYFAGLDQVNATFQHESTIQGIVLPTDFNLIDTNRVFTQFFQSDGNQSISISGRVQVAIGSGDTSDGSVDVTIQAGSNYWTSLGWTATPSSVSVPITVFDGTDGLDDISNSDGDNIGEGTINIQTVGIPSATSGTLTVTFGFDSGATITQYRQMNFTFDYGVTIDENNERISYQYNQDNSNYTEIGDYGTFYFSDGPSASSLSALKDSSDTNTSQWRRVGETPYITHPELLLREYMDAQRGQRRNIRATLYGEYEPENIVVYDLMNFLFLGGSWDSQSYRWSGSLLEIDIVTGSDTITTIYTARTSGSTGGGGGVTIVNPSGALDLGTNLNSIKGLTPADSSFIVGDGSKYVAESGATARASLELGGGDSPTFAGLTVDSLVIEDEVRILQEDVIALGLESNALFDYTLQLFGRTLTIGNDLDSVITFSVNAQDLTEDRTWTPTIADASDSQRGVVSLGAQTFSGAKTFDSVISDSLVVEDELRILQEDVIGSDLSIQSLWDVKVSNFGRPTFETLNVLGLSTFTGAIDANSTSNFQGLITIQSSFQSDNFALGTGSTGWLADGGDGYGVVDNSGRYHVYTDDLTVRGRLRVFELDVKQIQSIGGTEVLSVANGKVATVSGSAGEETVTLDDPEDTNAQPFAVGDLIVIQQFNPNSNTVVKQEFRVVRESPSASGIQLYPDEQWGGTPSLIEEGDFMVAYGNIGSSTSLGAYVPVAGFGNSAVGTDGRDNIIWRNVEGKLIVRLQTGIDSYNDFATSPEATTVFAYGDLDGFSDYSATAIGLLIGRDNAEHITADATNGIRFIDGANSNEVLASFNGTKFLFGDQTETENFILFDNSGGTLTAELNIDTFNLNTATLKVNSTGTTYPSASANTPVTTSDVADFRNSNFNTNSYAISSNRYIKLQFDYGVTIAGGATPFASVLDVELQVSDNNSTWVDYGLFSDTLIQYLIGVLRNPYFINDNTTGNGYGFSDVNSNNNETIITATASGSASYIGAMTFYFYVADVGSNTHIRFNIKESSGETLGLAEASNISIVDYDPVTELNPSGVFIRLNDSMISSNGNIYTDTSLIT